MSDNLKFIFVHGLAGWGSYDERYHRLPYWGMHSGDLITFLRAEGFDCYAASVSPTGSAWDRACELYAQLAGTKTDYGAVHSERNRHERFGPDFSACPLIRSLDEDTRLVLIGHSFGGATVRLFSQWMACGNTQERNGTDPADLSPLFAGGMEGSVRSIVALASPMNGTTAYDLFEDPAFDPRSVKASLRSRLMASLMTRGTRAKEDGRSKKDYASYDMHIDRAQAMNEQLLPLPSVFYFSVPCSGTILQEDGTYRPDPRMEPMFTMRSCQIGAYTGKTRGGFVIDESWRENDGLVNTISAAAPLNAPMKPLDRDRIEPGVWNVFPTFTGDHMSLQGGLMRRHDIRDFYQQLLTMINNL